MSVRILRRVVVGLGLALTPAASLAASITIFNTGNGSTTDGAVDPHWTYTQGSTTSSALVANNPGVDFFNGFCCGGGPWTPDTSTSSWLVDNISSPQSGGNPLSFQTTFDLTGLNPLTAVISGAWGIDDGGSLFLNGHLVSSLPGQNASHWDNASLTPFLDGTIGDFLPGLNTLAIVFDTNDNAFEGVNVRVSGAADPLAGATPLPAALPLFATGLGIVGWLSRRRKLKGLAATAAD
jgi:hypothetical protein